MPRPRFQPVSARVQRGAVLFISLMVLILLSLLGVAAMQVTTMQERMAGNYRVDNLSFQNAEARVQQSEDLIRARAQVDLADLIVNEFSTCLPLNASTWVAAAPTAGRDHIQNLGPACGYTSLRRDLGVDDFVPYRVTSTEFDDASVRASRTVLQSIYIPVPPVAVVPPPPVP